MVSEFKKHLKLDQQGTDRERGSGERFPAIALKVPLLCVEENIYQGIGNSRTSLVFQWLRFCTPNAGGPGSIPGSGNQIPHAVVKSLHTSVTTEDPVSSN